MKEYIIPKSEVINVDEHDIITTSPGTTTTPKDQQDGIWDFDQG